MLQLDADLTGFPDAVAAVDEDLAADLAGYGGGRMLAGPSLYEDVVKSICGTNTTWRQAVVTINRIAGLGRGDAFPEPADILRAGEDWLRAEARVGYRSASIIAAARAAIDGTLGEIEDHSAREDGERVYAELLTLPGVGPATAGFLVLLMGHFERPSVDSATIRVAARSWFGGKRPTPRQVVARVQPAGRFAGLVLA
jgi:3-methyladenine DNA glycosylase/8-oxoguanine DNA glycosylase